MVRKVQKKPRKAVKDLSAKSAKNAESRVVGGRDAASGLATGKRMHKPYSVTG